MASAAIFSAPAWVVGAKISDQKIAELRQAVETAQPGAMPKLIDEIQEFMVDTSDAEKRRLICIHGYAMLKLEKPLKARDLFLKSLEFFENYDDALAGLGEAYIAMNRADEARTAWEKLTQGKPQLAAGWAGLGLARQREQFYPEAEENYRKALMLDPKNRRAAVGIADCLMATRKFTEAAGHYSTLISEKPDADLLYKSGICKIMLSDYDQAAKDLATSVDLAPTRSDAGVALGFVHFSSGKFRDALACFDLALRREPKNMPARFFRGITLMRLGQKKDAAAEFAAVSQTYEQPELLSLNRRLEAELLKNSGH